MKTEEHVTIYRQDYTVPTYLVESIFLTVQLHEEHTDVIARTVISRNPAAAADKEKILVLDGEELELLSIVCNGAELSGDRYQLDDRKLAMPVESDRLDLEITTRIYPDRNTSLEGLYRSNNNYCTQCEAEGFRKITYYIDRPDNLAKFTTRIEGDRADCPVMLSNGNIIEQGEMEGGRHYVVWQDPFPKPCYLFALVAGQLFFIEDSFTTRSGRDITLRIYVEERNIAKCGHAMLSLKKSMAWDEEVYGLEYDLDIFMIVAVDDFNMGAMENKGLNIFNSKYILALPETATDDDYLGIEGVVAHEYFHNWTGNRVTCRDWFQLSLKEGLTVFRDQEFSADMNSPAVQRIDDVRMLRTHQFREDSGPMAHPVRPDSYQEINNFYTSTVYNKGAEVIRMMHTLLGADGFRKGMDLYFARHDGQAVTCDDFVAAMSDANGYDLKLFKNWYSQSGTPELTVATAYDEAAESFTLSIAQSCPATPGQKEKKPFHIPVAIGLLDSSGKDITFTNGGNIVLEVKKATEKFLFKNMKERPVVSFLRGFSAPVKVLPFQSPQELMFLMARDSDLYNRWEAASQLAQTIILEKVIDLQAGRPLSLADEYVEAVAANISTGGQDKALLAQALQLPPETYLATCMELVDPDNIHKARAFVKAELGSRLAPLFADLYQENNTHGAYEITPSAMGARSLKNVALGYLMAVEQGRSDGLDWCIEQCRNGSNMTDVVSALHCLADTDVAERSVILEEFYGKWRHDPLVMDKWFMLQAISSLEGTLDEVKRLMTNVSFSIRNPNKVRSLIGAFCSMNHLRFHADDGAGYVFLGDRIIELNSINPQIAARLVTPFTSWRKYDGERQIMMRDQLERIAGEEGISRDVYEIVKKSL